MRRGHAPGRGKWSLPGGRIEVGETGAEAAEREVFEETGLRVEVGQLLATVTLGRYVVEDFAATVIGGTLSAGDDADEVRWCLPEEMRRLPMTAGLVDELRRMGAL